jgi:rhodanese-related sulfurtransferase
MHIKTAHWLGTALLVAMVEIQAGQHAPVAPGANETQAAKLHEELGQGKQVLIIDVRDAKEFAAGHVPGAINIPVAELAKRIAEMKVPKDTVIVTVCEHGGRSSRAALELQKLGFKTTSFCRLDEWKKAGYKTEKREQRSQATPGMHKFTCHHYCQSEKEVATLDDVCDCGCQKPYHECMKET